MYERSVLAICVAAVIAVAGSAIVVFAVNDDSDASAEEYDITGHWYLVRMSSIDSAGSYAETDTSGTSNMYDHGLDIIEQSHSVFYGSYLGHSVTGSYVSNVIEMCGTNDGNEFYVMGTVVDGGTLRGHGQQRSRHMA